MEAIEQAAGTAITNPSSYGENPNAQATADGAGKYFALPDGATYITGTVDTGVVVEIKGRYCIIISHYIFSFFQISVKKFRKNFLEISYYVTLCLL